MVLMNIPEMLHALHETDSLMSDTDPKKPISCSMTVIVITVIKVNYEGIMKADS